MSAKRFAQIALLLFVALSIGYVVFSESRKPAADAGWQSASPPLNPNSKVVAYYFHGNFRCVSCRKLESVSQEAVINGFPDELKSGELQWIAVNVEQAGNEHFVTDYRLFSRALVIVRYRNGQQVEYKNLMKAWELLRDDDALKKYVQSEVRGYLRKS